MKPVKLSELIDALESESPEYGNWVDGQTGSVVHLAHSLISAVEEGGENALEGVGNWEKEEVEIAKAVIENLDDRFVAGPTRFDFHEYRQMERFIRTVGDAEATDALWRAIKGQGRVSSFQGKASRLGLLYQWFEYREKAMEEFVQDWAQARQIPYG
jgi:hypothetical protein